MAAVFAFPDNDPVLGPPTVDGFTGVEDAGVVTTEAEPGYGLGMRVNFESGSLLPHVVVQGIRAGGRHIYVSFMVRFDNNFDDEDVVVIALRDRFAPATHDEHCRRIDIYPVHEGLGAGTAAAGAGTDIRTNQAPQAIQFWKGKAAGGWDPLAATSVPGFDVKVRSWKPPVPPGFATECAWSVEVAIPTDTDYAGSDWIGIGAEFALYLNVIRVCGSGACQLPGPVADTFFSNQFTWPAENANPYLTGTLDGTLAIAPGLYGRAVIPALAQPPGANPAVGVKFVGGAAGIGVLSGGVIGSNIAGTSPNTLIARVKNDSPDASGDAPRVTAEFRLANWGLGSPGFENWAKIAVQPGVNPTTPVSLPHGTASADLTTAWTLSAAQQNQYKPPHQHQCMWVQLDDGGPASVAITGASNATPIRVTTGTPHGLATGARVVVSGVGGNTGANNGPLNPDWIVTVGDATHVDLNGSAGSGNYTTGGTLTRLNQVTFAESSQRRNMDFQGLSAVERPAEVSGVGYPPPAGGYHDFVLIVNVRRFDAPDQSGKGDPPDPGLALTGRFPAAARLVPTWTWIVHGYRDTGLDLKIGARSFRVYDPAPGAFGYLAQHDGPATDELNYQLTGGGIKHQHDNIYTLRVPHDGVVTIGTRVAAEPPLDTRPGCLGLLLRLLRRLWKLLRARFGR